MLCLQYSRNLGPAFTPSPVHDFPFPALRRGWENDDDEAEGDGGCRNTISAAWAEEYTTSDGEDADRPDRPNAGVIAAT